MKKLDLKQLCVQLQALAVFRRLLQDPVVLALCRYLSHPTVKGYAAFAAAVYETPTGTLGEHLQTLCENDENVYVRIIGANRPVPPAIADCTQAELRVLQTAAELTTAELHELLDWKGFLPELPVATVDLAGRFAHRMKHIGQYGYGIYAQNRMFYIDGEDTIIPVRNPDPIRLCDLVDYQAERQIILNNTRALLEGRPAANILLTGDAGTGKSATVKAVGNELFAEGLRIIEVRKDQLEAIPRLLDELAENPLKFVLFIDDLSFLSDDDHFNALKAVLEGSVSAKSKNVVIYATSNRHHIIREAFSDREGDEIHRNDTVQELISLSERFGIHVTFQKPSKETFLRIVRHLADREGLQITDEELAIKAERFALERGGRSARLARQLIDGLLSNQKN